MQIYRLVLAGALVTNGVVACIGKGMAAPPVGTHDVITVEELQHVKEISLYDAVRRLRPHFLRSRSALAVGRPGVTPLMLYVDGEKMESLDYLRQLSPRDVIEVRFYEPQVANTRFARYRNGAGAIEVVLRMARPDTT